ncbi:T9SS type A sorting domain-containing protein [Salibacteraceae bacterium]|jgi:hypothetical protein|nr:T9SS type A sorting domain-containing protein [Salibacteraceae bacterium]
MGGKLAAMKATYRVCLVVIILALGSSVDHLYAQTNEFFDADSTFNEVGFEITLFNSPNGFGLMIMSEYTEVYSVEVFDVQGTKAKSFSAKIECGQVNTHEDISNNLKSGIYIVIVRYQGLVWSARFEI